MHHELTALILLFIVCPLNYNLSLKTLAPRSLSNEGENMQCFLVQTKYLHAYYGY